MGKKYGLIFGFLLGMLFAFIGASFAQELSEDKTKFKDSTGKEWVVSDSEVVKIEIKDDNNLDEDEKVAVKEALKGKIHVEAKVAKNDYVDEFDRGTVYFNDETGNKFDPDALKMRNYSYHKVIIPDGTTVDGVNFTQKEPYTDAIDGKNLTFKNCNLKNVVIDDSWILIDCLSIQGREYEEDGFLIHEVNKDDKWVEVRREEIISDDINSK